MVFNVKDFGARGDGVTNDTQAIQNAIDAARITGGGIVYFPSGTYMVDRLHGIGSNITLKGNLDAVLKLNPQGAKPLDEQFGIIVMEGPNYPVTDVIIEGLIFDGNKLAQDPTPIDAGQRPKSFYSLIRIWRNVNLSYPVERITIRNSVFRNGIGSGIEFEGVNYVTLENVQFENNGHFRSQEDGKLVAIGDGIYITGSNFTAINVTAIDNADTGITIEGMEVWGSALIRNCTIKGKHTTGIGIAINKYQPTVGRTASHDVLVENSYIEVEPRDMSVYAQETTAINIEVYGEGIEAPRNVTIKNCKVVGSIRGILVKGTNITIDSTDIGEGLRCNILLTTGSNYTITNNFIHDSKIGIEASLTATISHVKILRNTFINIDKALANGNIISDLEYDGP